ncbi:uncharacterized protein MAM_07647 [Metarhizium album ARSEF 1941]|uniref:Uncharacterized protein n=1 Tax=Metarhizium album (strain ARSEF 1941) TaxID=1081103 RepID=A0A0B2WL85_METAS|nr:uncharacterized protein MAM_07647 [Metarhizium album ARSEF 1941]KHN94459.1 hypothetical protein MAM_07647 [Metarhizium album ARSEF 1941]
MRRQSTGHANSDASSACSVSTTASYAKEALLDNGVGPRRGLRQKARDVVSDLGKPPTWRQDAKDGKHTSSFGDPGFLTELSRPPKF